MKLGIGLIFLLLFGGEAFAGVTLNLPGLTNQGSFFKVAIKEDGRTQSEFYTIDFAGNTYRTFLEEGGKHVVFVPVDVAEKIGRREIAVYKEDRKDASLLTKEDIVSKRVNFPKSGKIFQRPPYTKAQLARLKKEQELLNGIYSKETPEYFFNGDLIFARPLGSEAERVSSEFGAIRKIKVGKDPKIHVVRHYGVDYSVPEGTPVFAVEDGIVRFAGNLLGAGNTVIIDHGYGLFSVYEHLSEAVVRADDLVRMGEMIAYSGKTGNATGTNLYFGVKLHNVWVDPKYFLARSAEIERSWKNEPASIPEPQKLLEKVYAAQKKLKDIPIALETQEIKKKERVVGRQIALLARDQDEDKDHIIYLRVPHPIQCKNFTFSVLTSGYEVERVSGCGASKLVFRVWLNGKRLIVLSGKHWWIPPEFSKEQNYAKLAEGAKEAIYTPFADDFYDHKLVLKGFEFLNSAIEKSKTDLRAKEVVSRALARKFLADAIPSKFILNVGVNEQMDHSKFKNNRKRAADEVLIEYALNPECPFCWSVSTENARGPFQFTNRKLRGNVGTYDAVVANYEEIELNEDFEAGTRDLDNMIKIATALLDMELAKFPLEVHESFEKDYRFAAIYPAACYNGGCGVGFQLYKWIKKNKYQVSLENFDPALAAFTYYRYAFKGGKKFARKVIASETKIYLQKQMFLWSYIDDLEKELKERLN